MHEYPSITPAGWVWLLTRLLPDCGWSCAGTPHRRPSSTPSAGTWCPWRSFYISPGSNNSHLQNIRYVSPALRSSAPSVPSSLLPWVSVRSNAAHLHLRTGISWNLANARSNLRIWVFQGCLETGLKTCCTSPRYQLDSCPVRSSPRHSSYLADTWRNSPHRSNARSVSSGLPTAHISSADAYSRQLVPSLLR